MAGFMVYWSKEFVSNLKMAGDKGDLSVIFGSQHTKMPSISRVKVGDVIYPVTLAEGTLCVMGRLPVDKVEVAFDYLMHETGEIHSAWFQMALLLNMCIRLEGFFIGRMKRSLRRSMICRKGLLYWCLERV